MRTDTNNDLYSLLRENIKLSKAILRNTNKTAKAMNFMKIMSILRLLLIAVPIVLAIIYVPPFLNNLINSFGNIFGGEQFEILNKFKDLNSGSNLNLGGLQQYLNK